MFICINHISADSFSKKHNKSAMHEKAKVHIATKHIEHANNSIHAENANNEVHESKIQAMLHAVEDPVDIIINTESDMLKEARKANCILRYLGSVAQSMSNLMHEGNRYIILHIILSIIMLFAYAWLSRFFMRFISAYLDIYEIVFVIAHWTFAYIIIYITMEVFNIASEMLNMITCIMLLFAVFELIEIVRTALIDNYKSQQFFIHRLALLLKSIAFGFAITFTGLFFSDIFYTDEAVVLGAYQLQSILVVICCTFFMKSIRLRVDKIMIKYIKQKQKQVINFQKTIMEILFFNILNFVMDIWFWLGIGTMCALCLLWFVSLRILTFLCKIAITIFIIWFYYICLRLIKGAVLLYIKQHDLHQRYIVYRLMYKVLPMLKYIGLSLLTVCVLLIWDFSLLRTIKMLSLATPIKILFMIYCLGLFWNICVYSVEYYCFIKWYTTGLLTNSPMVRILASIIKTFMGAGSILIFMAWLGYDPVPLMGSLSIVVSTILFGAQTVIKDLAAGFFLVLDNVFDVGDVVEIDSRFGIVEALTLFSVKVRLENGALLTMQYGDVRKIGNKSRSYCFAIINATVSYENNVDDVIKALQEVYAEIKTHPQLGKKIISPIEMRGITKLNGDEVIVQCRFKTKPRFDMPITRLFYVYLKQKFETMGIVVSDPRLIMLDTREKTKTKNQV